MLKLVLSKCYCLDLQATRHKSVDKVKALSDGTITQQSEISV